MDLSETGWLIVGLSVVAVGLLGYLASLRIRRLNIERRMQPPQQGS